MPFADSPLNARPRLLVVSHTYASPINRGKLVALSQHFEVACATCRTSSAFGLEHHNSGEASHSDITMHYLDVIGNPSSTTRYFFKGLWPIINAKHDFILVESEPWSLIRWQVWLMKTLSRSPAVFGEFSWENVERTGLKGFFSRLAYRAATATAQFFIAGNRDAAEILTRRGAKRVLTSPQLGVDPDQFFPVSDEGKSELRRIAGIPAGVTLVGFCGRFVAAKGLPTLLKAVEIAGLHLVLLGSGKLEDEMRSRKLPWLTILPPTDHAGVAPFMQMLDLFVLPSITVASSGRNWREQFGHVLIEAMACAVPCLGSDSGAIPEVIGDPDCIFPEGDSTKLAELLRRATTDRAWLAAKGASALERATQFYTHDALAKEWASFMLRLHKPEQKNEN